MDPVYDMRDLDEDGSLDNPGDILYHVPTRTGQKDNYSIGIGFSEIIQLLPSRLIVIRRITSSICVIRSNLTKHHWRNPLTKSH